MAEEVSGGNPAAASGDAAAASSATPVSTPDAGSTPGSAIASVERAAASLESASPTDKLSATGDSALESKPGGAISTPAAAASGAVFHLPKTKEDYDRILANTRERARQEAQAEFDRTYGPLKAFANYDPDVIREAVELHQQFGGNPVEIARQILAEAADSEEDLIDPEPDYVSPDGKSKFYSESANRKLLQNLEKRILNRMKPALDLNTRVEQQERVRGIVNQARAQAKEAFAEIKQYPHFSKYANEIADKLQAMTEVRQKYGTIAAMHMAYQSVINANQVKIRQEMEENIRLGNLKKARGSEGQVIPGDASIQRKPVKDGDVQGLAKRFAELEREMV